MSELPAPMTPAGCDLQDFPFMPLMVARLRKSTAWVKARRNPALGFYMINLWGAAWHEVPAGSLEDDDDVLADAAMCDPSKWEKVREAALRGWVKCSDDRLYHPVVAERVIEAWTAKTERKEKNEHENTRKRLEREEKQRHFATLKAAGIHKPWTTQLTELRQLVQDLSVGQVPDESGNVLHLSRLREGQGQGQGQGDSYSDPYGSGGAAAGKKPKTAEQRRKSELWRAIKTLLVETGESKDLKAAGAVITNAITRFDEPTALAAIEATLHAKPAGAIAYLEAACQQATGQRLNKQETLEAGNLAAAERFAMEE